MSKLSDRVRPGVEAAPWVCDEIRALEDRIADGTMSVPLLEWAVSRWRAEVENRPMVNIHRRTLDNTWRQVIRYAGGDPDALVGPSHDAMLAAAEKEAT